MARRRNYLLGKGELLTEPVVVRMSSGPKKVPYSFAESKQRLAPRIREVARAVDVLPATACPADQAVGLLTLHPAFMAKSYFPAELLGAIGLRAVGSRAATITLRRPQGQAWPASLALSFTRSCGTPALQLDIAARARYRRSSLPTLATQLTCALRW